MPEHKDATMDPATFKVGDWFKLQGELYLIGHIQKRPSGITLRLEQKFKSPIFLDFDNKVS